MTGTRLLGTTKAIKSLSDRMSVSIKVNRHDNAEEPQAWTLAYNFSELEESFRKFIEVQLPKLTTGDLNEGDLDNLLHDIGEDFRHILYHITAPEFYSHLRPNADAK